MYISIEEDEVKDGHLKSSLLTEVASDWGGGPPFFDD
jgi:hypothetical protein